MLPKFNFVSLSVEFLVSDQCTLNIHSNMIQSVTSRQRPFSPHPWPDDTSKTP